MNITAFDLAQRFVGVKEVPGMKDNPMILSMLRLDGEWPEHDEVPWCSAFVNYIAWLLRLPRSKSLAARSWLGVGETVVHTATNVGFDVVVLSRGTNPSAGHVGFFAGWSNHDVEGTGVAMDVDILGGNQSNTVSVASFSASRILGIRRLA